LALATAASGPGALARGASPAPAPAAGADARASENPAAVSRSTAAAPRRALTLRVGVGGDSSAEEAEGDVDDEDAAPRANQAPQRAGAAVAERTSAARARPPLHAAGRRAPASKPRVAAAPTTRAPERMVRVLGARAPPRRRSGLGLADASAGRTARVAAGERGEPRGSPARVRVWVVTRPSRRIRQRAASNAATRTPAGGGASPRVSETLSRESSRAASRNRRNGTHRAGDRRFRFGAAASVEPRQMLAPRERSRPACTAAPQHVAASSSNAARIEDAKGKQTSANTVNTSTRPGTRRAAARRWASTGAPRTCWGCRTLARSRRWWAASAWCRRRATRAAPA